MVPDRERRDRRDTWHGYSNAFSQAFEIVATLVIFVLIGLWIDGRADTRPLFTVAFAMFAVVGLGARTYYSYKAQVARDEEGKPWLHKSH